MGLSEWLGFSKREDTPTAPAGVTPPPRSAVGVTESQALSLVNVYRAVQILGTGGGQLTMDVWRGSDRIDTPSVVARPDINLTPSAWLNLNIHSLALTGNAYWRVRRDGRGPRNLEVMDPHRCYPNEDGTLTHNGVRLQPNEFRHLALMRRAGQPAGLGPIQAARAELAGAFDLRDFAANTFHDGDVPTGVLSTDQPLSPDQAKAVKESWRERDRREVAVLGSGVNYSPVMLNPEDAQFIEAQRFTKTEIATLFGIPAHLLLASVEGSSMTYTNIASADLAFIRWTLMTYLLEIEGAMTAVLPGTQTARFNVDAITRPDITTRYAAHKTALDAGFMTVDEVRDIEGLAPMEGTTP